MEVNVQALRDRLVGQRFYNTDIDEACTVVGVSATPPMALMQYDDGMFYDEPALPEILSDEHATQLGVSSAGIEDSKYAPLGCGPTLEHACDQTEHDWTPLPSELFHDPEQSYSEQYDRHRNIPHYDRVVRCRRCGLSGSVLANVAGHPLPDVCARCGSDIIPGTDEDSTLLVARTDDGTNPPGCDDYVDCSLCGDCVKALSP
jgi:hypothetical protein